MARQRRRSGGRKAVARRSGGIAALTYIGMAAFGAVVALAATGKLGAPAWSLPSLPDWSAPTAEHIARPEPRPTMTVHRSVPTERAPTRSVAPDRSIATAAIPVPRPPRPLPTAHAQTGSHAAPAVIAPKPKADVPSAQPAAAPAAAARVTRLSGVAFPVCGEAPSRGCVIDGDTFVLDGKAFRIADIEVPESGDPECRREAELADKARRRLRELLSAGPVQLVGLTEEKDVYGRKLRTVLRDGRPIGDTLVAEGLARRPTGRNRGWCG